VRRGDVAERLDGQRALVAVLLGPQYPTECNDNAFGLRYSYDRRTNISRSPTIVV
jgi:hypothetical protein